MTNESQIEAHYSHNSLLETILHAIGKEPSQITRNDLAPVDEFHVRGQDVSRELATAAALQPGIRILDAGCGLGGACRMLAAEYGCQVTGIDITSDYIRTAEKLSALTGLQQHTRFVQGSVLALPFADGSFDAVWSQHVQMNIADKKAFYTAINQVLTKGGRFVYYDVLGNDQPVYYPVPWAFDASLSFLITSRQLQALLSATGFIQIQVTNETENGIRSLNALLNRIAQKGLPASGLHLLMGDTALEKLNNLRSNLIEKRVVLESGIYEKAT
ncbi:MULTISPECIES: class I SAM-dependent methyltransferase [Niastella]|uniref:Methyltransferase domain-containing protein n=1 Tax=Niastella soli TaxID=2821487 RepID=A0ABS3YZT0_9BACT|nr:class I SAM-dependent methyltransferase [Niastella soli]MBO9203432.1 methyltransferase domain-containing protein [Niastella soli]